MKVSKRTAAIHDQFVGEGYHTLALPIGQLEVLQDILDCGPAFLYAKIAQNQWRTKDIQEIIRLGLIGGGMAPKEAFDLVHRCVVSGYLLDYVQLAAALMMISLSAPEDDPAGGQMKATKAKSPQTRKAKSAGQASMSSLEPPK